MTLPLPDKTTSPLVHSRVAEKRRNDRAWVFSPRVSNYTRKTGPPARVNLGTRFDLWTTRLAGQAFHFYGASSRRKFIGWLHPIYRHRSATFRRTNDAPRPVSRCARNHLDFPPSDDFATNKAITLFVQRIPLPELIEPLQRLQFFFIR